MEMTGTRQIAADRAAVWAALNDPEVLKAAIPGCQELHGSPDTGFEATVKQKVGPVSATFHGAVQLSNVVPGESYHIAGEGKGGAAGFAKGGADVKLEDKDGGTLLSYDVKASVGGKLAQLGSRLIDGFAKKMADQFFENFQKAVEGAGAAAAAAAVPAAAAAEAPAEAPAPAPAPAPAAVAPAAPAPSPATAAAPAKPAAAQPAKPPVEAKAAKPGWLKRLFGGKS
jgi:carbon monoxide dehydrogenase subunit G